MKQWLSILFVFLNAGLLDAAQPLRPRGRAAQASPSATIDRTATRPRHDGDHGWLEHQTGNFHICCVSPVDPIAVGTSCEALCEELCRKWLGGAQTAEWSSPCSVVFHPSLASYLRAVGREGQQTLGCSSVTVDRGKVLSRRIDIRGDRPDSLSEALPHELTHVILADLFADQPLPRWADEGVAVLSDSAEKQGRHRRDLVSALDQQKVAPVADLLTRSENPSAFHKAAFYGQSASLVEFLVARGTPSGFLTFVRQGSRYGYDLALRNTYGIQNVGHLERLWRLHVADAAARSQSRVEPASFAVDRP